jgi:ubiquinone/menaquinone biosynthesis C-methylase UbiE
MSDAKAQSYYADGGELLDPVLAALDAAGRPTEAIDSDDLAALDEFHGRGRSATVALLRAARLRPGERVLDVGAGIGGPARTMARHFGAEVCALDPTARFAALAAELNRRCSLDDRITVVRGEAGALPFADGRFDLLVNQAVWPSVEDKRAMFAEAHRVLAPGGRLAVFEVLAGPAVDQFAYPVPWANGPQESHLVDAAEARRLLGEAGFEPLEWLTGPDALVATLAPDQAGDPLVAAGAEGVDLSLLMPEFERRMTTLGENVVEGRIELLFAVLARP